MPDTTRDDVGSMKRSFSEMQKNETVDIISSCSLPAAFRAGYFIAIRGENVTASEQKKSMKPTPRQSCCIFGCWDDAQIHLKQMKIKGRNVEYDAFERIDDASRYAFGKNEDKDQTPDVNNEDSISPFIGAYRKRQVELQGSLHCDAALSGLEELPQDILTNIYRFLCPGSCQLADISTTISVIGMISKHIFQSCARYVRHEPLSNEGEESSTDSLTTLAFFLGNAARVKRMRIRYYHLSESAFLMWLRLVFLDLSTLECLHIHRNAYCDALMNENNCMNAKDKWKLVEDGLVSVPFVKEMCKKKTDDINEEFSQYIAASGVPSLEIISMSVYPKSLEIYNSLFLCAIDRLVELEFNYYSEDEYFADDKKAAFKGIEELVCAAPRLRFLGLHYGWGDTILDLNIQSDSLETLELMDSQTCEGPAIQALDINCSSLTELAMRIVVEKFDLNQFIKSSSYGVIEDMHIGFDSLHDDYPEESSITGKQVLEMLDNMSSLRDLHLDGVCNNVFPNMDLPSANRVVSYSTSLDNAIHRDSSLKHLRINTEYLFHFEDFQLILENVESFCIIVSGKDGAFGEKVKIAELCQTIERKMPKIERFSLIFPNRYLDMFQEWNGNFDDNIVFSLKSETLKEIWITNCFLAIETDECPLLEKYNGDDISVYSDSS